MGIFCSDGIVRTAIIMAATAAALLLTACHRDDDPVAVSCAIEDQKPELLKYMQDQYFWYASMPNPDPAPFTDMPSYFHALLFTGDASLPGGDIWSYTTTSADYRNFYEEGRTLGWGLSVAGLEIVDQPAAPLRVRYIEAQSPAAQAGLVRGDTVVTINGQPSADYVSAFNSLQTVLTANAAGDALNLVVRNMSGAERNVELIATEFDLTPVSLSGMVNSPAGTPIGYVVIKDFIPQILTPLEEAFATFKANGVNEIVLDLRYNGGGRVANALTLASLAGGANFTGNIFARLNYSDKQQANNVDFLFGNPPSAMSAVRVFVLTGVRTCSASELIVNGLAPFVDVVQIGDTTCGKPVGFQPVDDQCGTTYSAVNFEVLNANGEGRYWNGLAPNCTVADDFDHALGDGDEALLAAARNYVDTGACPIAVTARSKATMLSPAARRPSDDARPPAMIVR